MAKIKKQYDGLVVGDGDEPLLVNITEYKAGVIDFVKAWWPYGLERYYVPYVNGKKHGIIEECSKITGHNLSVIRVFSNGEQTDIILDLMKLSVL